MKKIVCILIYSTFLFTSCNQNNTQNPSPFINYEAYSTLSITNAVPGTYFFASATSSQSIHILPGTTSGVFTNDVFTYESVATSGYLSYNIYLSLLPDDIGCADIEITTYLNGSLFDIQTFQIGHSSLNPNITCDSTVANIFNKIVYLPYQ